VRGERVSLEAGNPQCVDPPRARIVSDARRLDDYLAPRARAANRWGVGSQRGRPPLSSAARASSVQPRRGERAEDLAGVV